MQTTYIPPNPIDTMMPYDFRKLEKNLLWMVSQEPQDPAYWGPRIRELSDRMGV